MQLLGILILFAGGLFAELTATLTGRVTSPTGTTISGVEVRAINVETGLRFSTQTNEEGLYRITNLPPGAYRVVLQKHGFQTAIRPGLELHVQDVVALNFEMRIGSIDQSFNAEDGEPLLQAETAVLGQIINRNVIAELPVLGRNPYSFVGLTAGAAPAQNAAGRGLGFAINGQRPESANFLLDGSNYNTNPDRNNPGQTVPNDAVREYRLLTNSFTAEYGRGAGFIANLVTRNGTNEFHGSAYDYARNSALAANSFENNANGKRKTAFNGHQAGASVGGPILADKAFFFGAVETTLIRSSEVQSYYVPTPQLLQISSPATRAIFLKYPPPSSLSNTGALFRPVKRFPRSAQDSDVTVQAFALASRLGPVDTGAGAPQNGILGIARVDYAAGARMMITARHAFQHVDQLATVSQPYGPQLDPRVQIRNRNATINLTQVWSAEVVTESRLSFGRLSNMRLGAGPNELFQSFPIMKEPRIHLPHGPATEGGPRNLFQAHQAVSWVRGTHHFKFGGEFVRYSDAIDVAFPGVTPAFFEVQDFVDGHLNWVTVWFDTAADGASSGTGGHLAPPNRRWHLRYNDAAWFIQDTWKLTPRLTLTPGLRWEYFGVQSSPGDEKARDVNFYLGDGATRYERFINGKVLRTMDAPGEYRNHFTRPDRNNFGPRAGLAFDLSGDGRTLLRAGAGVFFDSPFGRVPPQIRASATFNSVPFTSEMLDNPYAIAGTAISAPPNIERSDPDRRIPYVAAWNATVERELAGIVALAGSYIGSSGSQLELAVVENEVGSGGRPNERLLADYGPFTSVKSLAHSSYHSLQLKAEGRRIRPLRLQFGANYTWGHSIDNASAREEGVQGGLLDPDNLRLDRASSSFDQRHRFVTHFIWEIPAVPAAGRFVRQLSAGWQLSGILSFQTGQPFNVFDDRVDLNQYARPRVTGALPRVLSSSEMKPDPGVPNRFLYLAANSTRGDDLDCIPDAAPFACVPSIHELDNLLPRNFYRGPGSYFTDFALTRNVRLSEQARLQLRGEFHNLFNHANRELVPGLADGGYVLTSPQFDKNTVAGVLARYGGIPRQVVLAARVVF